MALLLVLITSAWNLVRLRSGLLLWSVLEKYAAFPGPAYIAATGALWAALGLVLVWAIWARRSWSPGALLGGALAYATWYWVDRIVLQPFPDPGWRFGLALTAAQLALIAAATLDSRNRFHFGREAHERQKQARKTA